MNKLLSGLVAGMVILATNGFAAAEDEPRNTQQDADAGTRPAPLEPGDLVVSEKEQEYLAALTKCESLSGSRKETCIEAVKKKLGHQ